LFPKFPIVDSPFRCPYDGKLMVVEKATNAYGEEFDRHNCWNCDFILWERPKGEK
jgi:ssDNA-binding Zn-finger/Zn-ribbon topoisomerase 1